MKSLRQSAGADQVTDSDQARRSSGIVAAIGAFDGVHRGHQRLLKDMVASAGRQHARSVCITFDPDPQRVVRRTSEALSLCPIADRIQFIEALGVEEVQVWPFTPEVASMSPEEFVSALQQRNAVREVWVGANFGFGRDRSGNADTLLAIGQRKGFAVRIAPLIWDGDATISSTRIRGLLRLGQVREAATLLGRRYQIAGNVMDGAKRGRQLGFPTANVVPPPEQLLPAEGVYAGLAHLDGNTHRAVANLGARPTFGESQMLLEVHLLDFQGDLYGQWLRFEFAEHVRSTRRFDSLDDLRAQIGRDVEAARGYLAESRLSR
jgi:riboflavin kinase/FMN adenylyltransferase